MATKLFGLKPSEEQKRYNFNIDLPLNVTILTVRKIISIIEFMKPLHTSFNITQPSQLSSPDHWELGLSELGNNTFLH